MTLQADFPFLAVNTMGGTHMLSTTSYSAKHVFPASSSSAFWVSISRGTKHLCAKNIVFELYSQAKGTSPLALQITIDTRRLDS